MALNRFHLPTSQNIKTTSSKLTLSETTTTSTNPKSIPLEAHAPPQHIITKIPSSGDPSKFLHCTIVYPNGVSSEPSEVNLQMGVHAAALALVVAAAHGRVIGPTSATAPLSDRVQKVRDELKAVADRVLHRSTSKGETAQPAFAGSWKTASTEGMDGYLDRAMGVGYLKRKIACKATQKQRLWQEGRMLSHGKTWFLLVFVRGVAPPKKVP